MPENRWPFIEITGGPTAQPRLRDYMLMGVRAWALTPRSLFRDSLSNLWEAFWLVLRAALWLTGPVWALVFGPVSGLMKWNQHRRAMDSLNLQEFRRLLHKAVKANDVDEVERLMKLDPGLDVARRAEVRRRRGQSALFCAMALIFAVALPSGAFMLGRAALAGNWVLWALHSINVSAMTGMVLWALQSNPHRPWQP